MSGKVFLARAHAFGSLAVIAIGSVEETFARPTVRIAVVAVATRVAVGCREFGTTLALASQFVTVSSRVEKVAVTC